MTADATLPASDDLTPEVLARIEADVSTVETTSPGWTFATNRLLKGDVPALLSGVRSRDARIVEAESERDHYRLMMAEAKAALAYAAERLDEFSYSELASAIDDEWCDEETGAPTASRTLARVKAEAWDACLDAIEQNELNTAQARDGNPYRPGAING